MKSVVVSGYGISSSLAFGGQNFMRKAASGDWSAVFGSEQLTEEAAERFSPDACRRMDEHTLYAILAAAEACDSARLDDPSIDRDRIGTVFSTLWGPIYTINQYFHDVIAKGPAHASPFLFPSTVTNAVIGAVARLLACRGASSMLVGCCPICYAFDLIAAGKADIVVTGGVETVARFYRAFFTDLGSAYRFEGSAVLVLEDEEVARARDAPVLARIYGHASASSPGLDDREAMSRRLGSVIRRLTELPDFCADRVASSGTMLDGPDYSAERAQLESDVLRGYGVRTDEYPQVPFVGLNRLLGVQSCLSLIRAIWESGRAEHKAFRKMLSASCREGGNISALLFEGAAQ
jgi:hypothetical protein